MYYSSVDVAKAHQIMAKFRPIAPKPPHSPDSVEPSSAFSCLRPRPCKARKRGRGVVPLANKRQRTASPPFLPLLPYFHQYCGGRLPLLPETPTAVEQDLLNKLQEPRVFAPQPVRPVGSSISVGSITGRSGFTEGFLPLMKKPEEVEEEMESWDLPVVISDSKNRVRLANAKYKEMVGQPECPWLESMHAESASSAGGLGLRAKAGVWPRRINGEVMLAFAESLEIPAKAEGFSCRVKVEWTCNGGKKSFVDAPCEVTRLYCDSKDYLFFWKIYTAHAFQTNCKA